MKKSLFITMEGIEGAGKSTQIEFIADSLERQGYPCIITREPGGTRLGEAVRDILLHGQDLSILAGTELLLMFSARYQHINEVILPAIADGKSVICDRFTDASYAYQGGGRGIPVADIAVLEQWVQQGLMPDLTLLFDASVETGLQRAHKRSEADRFESEETVFFERVRQAYLDRATKDGKRYRVIDAEQDISGVQRQLSAILGEYL